MNRFKTSKKILLLVGVLSASFLLSACATKPTANQGGGEKQAASNQPGPGGRGRMPDFGQPSRQADIRGIVKSIVGNQVVILKVDLQGGRNRDATSTEASTTNNGQAPVASLNIGGNGQGSGRQGGGGGGFGGFAGGGRQGGPGAAGGTVDRAAMLARLKAMSTGEETVIIPVGIKMLKMSVDNSTKKRTAVEAALTDVTADKTITIWLDSSVTDKKVAEFVLIN